MYSQVVSGITCVLKLLYCETMQRGYSLQRLRCTVFVLIAEFFIICSWAINHPNEPEVQ